MTFCAKRPGDTNSHLLSLTVFCADDSIRRHARKGELAMFTRRFYLVLTACVASLLIVSSARAQYKLETCEDLKIAEAHFGINTVETATCVTPAKTFSPKGTLRNVNAVYSFPKVPTGAGVTFIVTKNDANGEYVRDVDYSVSPNHTTAYARFTINEPGKYYLQLVNHYNKAQVWAATEFTVGEDIVGPRAVGNTAAGQGQVL